MNTHVVKPVMVIALITMLSGCDWWGKPAAHTKKDASSVKVVNVLSKELYDDAHIKGSINVDFMELEKVAATWDKQTPIVVYCSNYACTASSMGVQMLRKMGFTNVKAYEGGMAEWYQLHKQDPSYEVEGSAKEEYLTVPVQKPAQSHAADVQVISAEELKKGMQPAAVCTSAMGCCPASSH